MIFAPAITGPTASGKTALSIRLAKEFGFEIISADSMQIYRGMDIGTAKASAAEQAQVRHHLIDVVEASESFSAFDYRKLATKTARDIISRGRIPLFVGGTGLYIDTLMRADTQSDVPESSREFRERLEATLKTDEDKMRLWQRLREIDPSSAEAIHPNNTRRVIRAIEIFETTNTTKSELDAKSREKNSEFDVFMITLDFHSRETLYRRIDSRVDEMLELGLYDEVLELVRSGALMPNTTAGQAIGYKEMLAVIDGESTLEAAAEAIKLASRRYAKRQLTWFRHEKDAARIMVDREYGELRAPDELFAEAKQLIEEKIRFYI